MTTIPLELIDKNEIARRVGRLQQEYAGHPLVKRIDYNLGADWSDDPAVFIKVIVARKNVPIEEMKKLAERMTFDLIRMVGSEEIGLHSYLNFVD